MTFSGKWVRLVWANGSQSLHNESFYIKGDRLFFCCADNLISLMAFQRVSHFPSSALVCICSYVRIAHLSNPDQLVSFLLTSGTLCLCKWDCPAHQQTKLTHFYVCTYRRGLNPPHRVKSISMTTFTQQEIEFLQKHGNEVGLLTTVKQLRLRFNVCLTLTFMLSSICYMFLVTI